MKVFIVARVKKRYAAARGDPDASPTPEKAQAQHIYTSVPPPPVVCPQLPPPPRPPRFLGAAGRKRYAAARGDPDASPPTRLPLGDT